MGDATSLFKQRFGFLPTQVVRVPTPLELLGCSDLLDDGLSLTVALDRCISIAVAPRSDGKVELASSAFPQREQLWADKLQRNPAAAWADFPKSVLAELRRLGVHFGGFNAAILDEVPSGAGLNRFAATQVACALAVRQLHPYSLAERGLSAPPPREATGELASLGTTERRLLARLCQEAAQRFLGLRSSLQGPLSCLFAKAWHVMAIDLRFLTVDYLPLVGHVVVFCRASKAGLSWSGTAAARTACAAAAVKLRAKTLRSVEPGYLRANAATLTEPEHAWATYVCGEQARVVGAEKALRNDDIAQFGAYLSQSGDAANEVNDTAGDDCHLLLELSREHSGCLGVRLQPGGTLNLVPHHHGPAFIEHMAKGYRQRTGAELQLFLCQAADADLSSFASSGKSNQAS